MEPSEAMQVNVVKPLEDGDFRYARTLCDVHDQWQLVYEKKATRVWTKPMSDSNLHMIKARSEFSDVSAETAYDVLQDSDYRHKWDKYMLSTIPVGYLNPNNDICYYSLGSIPPFRSRDFVMQRSWLDTGREKFIVGHSVWHDKFPPNKTHIRGTIHLTVYFVRALNSGGCQLSYVTFSDPRGKLPSWFINRLTKLIAPKLFKKLHKACLNYPDWKRSHRPNWKPWLYPEIQPDYPKIDLGQCRPPSGLEQPIVDETEVSENSAVASKLYNGSTLDEEDNSD
ncbi:START domain-containing protein [Ditylenchus destructor]|nr:START domain-containing protein [Ditylenchus destructor]